VSGTGAGDEDGDQRAPGNRRRSWSLAMQRCLDGGAAVSRWRDVKNGVEERKWKEKEKEIRLFLILCKFTWPVPCWPGG
jgi:hypothetical protein